VCALRAFLHKDQELSAQERVAIPQMMSMASEMQAYFVQVRSMNKCEAADGALVGNLLMDAARTASNAERSHTVSKFVMRTAMLCECKCPHLDVLLSTIVENKYRRTKISKTKDPALLTASEAVAIGRSFSLILLQSNSPSAAVQQFAFQNLTIGELAQEYRWFRPMIEAIAKRLLAETPLGMKSRVFLGAAISIGSLLSALRAAIELWDTQSYTVAYATLALLALSMLMQTILVVVQVS
jgi:hypothetical protein